MNHFFPLIIASSFFLSCQHADRHAAYGQSPATKEILKVTTPVSLPTDSTKANLIIPGKSIGLTHINEPLAAVVKRLGKPDAGDAAMGKSISVWYAQHDTTSNSTSIYSITQMGVDDTARVKIIRITSPWFATKDGVHVGTLIRELEQYYTLKNRVSFADHGHITFIYETDAGAAFEVRQGKCKAIIVHEQPMKATTTYLLFHNDAERIKKG